MCQIFIHHGLSNFRAYLSARCKDITELESGKNKNDRTTFHAKSEVDRFYRPIIGSG